MTAWEVRVGDCRELLAAMEPASVDAIVTDPPYGLEFMGKSWDGADGFRRALNKADVERKDVFGRASRTSPQYRAGRLFQEWSETWASVALRVLKPGAHLVAFGGTRTYHRLTCALEDAGFEIRDSLMWLYGSGFPKSLDVSKAIDKAADYRIQAHVRRAAVLAVEAAGLVLPGNSRHDWTRGEHAPSDAWWSEFQRWLPNLTDADRERVEGEILATVRKTAGWFSSSDLYNVTAPATADARGWQGWGTALKPAYEPIVLARKPLAGTVAANVLEHGTGAINVDGCRIGPGHDGPRERGGEASAQRRYKDRGSVPLAATPGPRGGDPSGRWPANVLLDEEAAALLDEQSGTLASGFMSAGTRREGIGYRGGPGCEVRHDTRGDSGGASRFFYTAKASSGERHAQGRNAHPTVKPVALMRWLCRLVTPPGGLIVDPFCGSGSTGVGALAEGFRFIGMEQDAESAAAARNRIGGRLFANA